MKKIFSSVAALVLISSTAQALEIDASSVKVHFTGYKMAKKVAVPGFINNAEFNFTKTDGLVKEILEGTSANLDFDNVYTKDKIRDKNIHRTFISKLDSSKITAKLSNVSGDENEGKATASITFNNVTKEIPMTYVVKDNKLIVKGVINMSSDFNLANSYIALSSDKQISSLHGKKTHEDVEIYFDVDVK